MRDAFKVFKYINRMMRKDKVKEADECVCTTKRILSMAERSINSKNTRLRFSKVGDVWACEITTI